MTSEIQADIAVLMPKMTNEERFRIRYAGLANELSTLAVNSCFVESHTSFLPEEHSFTAPFDATKTVIGDKVQPTVVRDLTMSLDAKPLYGDDTLNTVHHPATNRFIADKSNIFRALPHLHPATLLIKETDVEMALDLIPGNRIVVKPITGMQSQGVQIVNKVSSVALPEGSYLAQEYIDTRGGMPEYGIHGMHNLRIVSIGGKAVGAIARLGGSESHILKDDYYGDFVHPNELSSGAQNIVHAVHSVLSTKPGNGNNVIAIDIMRGINAAGEQRDVLCEVNRRPVRISPWDLRDTNNLEPAALIEMGRRWDKAEAAMLAGLVD